MHNLPIFQDYGFNGRPHLECDQLQVIVPSYTFNCHGRVVRWGACLRHGGDPNRNLYQLELQVLRPLPVAQTDIHCFSLVGMYSQIRGPNFSPDETEHCIVIDIPTDDQIPVQPGDVVGFYSDYLDDNDDDGVQLDESMTDVTAYYRERSKIDPPTLSSCMLIAGPNNIDSTTTAAPVITVVVGKLLMHQHVPFCTIKQQGQTQALGAHTPISFLPLKLSSYTRAHKDLGPGELWECPGKVNAES